MSSTQFTILIVLIVVLSYVPWRIIFFIYKKTKQSNFFFKNTENDIKIRTIQTVAKTIQNLKKRKFGGTFIIDENSESNPFINNAQFLDAELSSALLTNIFEGKDTPLHDGAVILREGRIKYAAAYITRLSKQKSSNRKLGTRHRSALGLTENTNVISIVVSEENGNITVFKNGKSNIVSLKEFNEYLISIWI